MTLQAYAQAVSDGAIRKLKVTLSGLALMLALSLPSADVFAHEGTEPSPKY